MHPEFGTESAKHPEAISRDSPHPAVSENFAFFVLASFPVRQGSSWEDLSPAGSSDGVATFEGTNVPLWAQGLPRAMNYPSRVW